MEVKVVQNILKVNEKLADENRRLFEEKQVFVIDMMASPGAGKTSTILATIQALREKLRIAVIEGDIASKVDAEKIQAQGVEAVQINTGGACHLDGNMIQNALRVLDLDAIDLLIIENVGNLVCPAEFDLGQAMKLVISSVPEGDDKPLKYPVIFTQADALILNKVDLMASVDFDEEAFVSAVRRLNPSAPIFNISATKGEGVSEWTAWLLERVVGRG
ncbi:MAG: hydrogenase accessory protein HypB [Actinobacteria bacterium]|nr:MAG: hydrogenase accessory protein HypB [Actinomycetota bacterium]